MRTLVVRMEREQSRDATRKDLLAYEIDLQARRTGPQTPFAGITTSYGYFATWLDREHNIEDVEALTGEHVKGFLLYVQGLRQNAAGSRPVSRGRAAPVWVRPTFQGSFAGTRALTSAPRCFVSMMLSGSPRQLWQSSGW